MKRQTTILSIDDDVQICYALNELFRYQGWRTLTAHDVPSGLARFREEKPDIVLIDYHMPGISGIRGIELLRALSPEVPIIVFTIDMRRRRPPTAFWPPARATSRSSPSRHRTSSRASRFICDSSRTAGAPRCRRIPSRESAPERLR